MPHPTVQQVHKGYHGHGTVWYDIYWAHCGGPYLLPGEFATVQWITLVFLLRLGYTGGQQCLKFQLNQTNGYKVMPFLFQWYVVGASQGQGRVHLRPLPACNVFTGILALNVIQMVWC